MPREDVYRETGIEFMQLNSLYQLYAHKKNSPEVFAAAEKFLTVPDLLNYWLTGVAVNEFSEATTTQMYNPQEGAWSQRIIGAAGLDMGLFGEVVLPGTVLGPLLPEIAAETGAGSGVVVTVPACHDTASAIAAVPVTSEGGYAYLSSGTWSLLGMEMDAPVINDLSYRYNFTNEGGREGRITFHKNIMGLWIIQECKAYWDSVGKVFSWDGIVEMAASVSGFEGRIDPADPVFMKSSLTDDNMPERIRRYCESKGAAVPSNEAEIAACVFRSLAEKYAETLDQLEECTGKKIDDLYIIGGGCQNGLLCKWTAEATGRRVYAGPVEATALGNILIQAVAAGEVGSFSEGRRLIAENYKVKEY